MQSITRQFTQTLQEIREVEEKLSQGQFPDEEDVQELHEQLHELLQQRNTWLTWLKQNDSGTDISGIRTLEELTQAIARQESFWAHIQAAVQGFLSVHALQEEYQKDLTRFQQRLASCSREQLLEMEQTGELDLYRAVIVWIRHDRPGQEVRDLVKGYFGYAIAYALMDGQLVLDEAEEESVGEPEPEDPEEELGAEMSEEEILPRGRELSPYLDLLNAEFASSLQPEPPEEPEQETEIGEAAASFQNKPDLVRLDAVLSALERLTEPRS